MKSFVTSVLVLLIAGLGVYIYIELDKAKHQAPQSVKTEPLPLPQDVTPDIQHPITEPPVIIDSNADIPTEEVPVVKETEEPLPPLDESDNKIKEILTEIFGDTLVNQIFTQTGIIHRFVATIESLPKKKLPNKLRVLPPATGKFLVWKDSSDKLTVDTANYSRYSTYMQLLNMLETKEFVKWYTHYYPLIQEAYDALGYKDRYFNDRFIYVIDHLLETPEVIGTIRLVQPKVYYEYADPALETLSAGQKIVLRIGPENAAIVKSRLLEIRKELAAPQVGD